MAVATGAPPAAALGVMFLNVTTWGIYIVSEPEIMEMMYDSLNYADRSFDF